MRFPPLANIAAIAALSVGAFIAAQTTPAKQAQAKSPKPAAISGVPDIVLFNGVIYTGEGFADYKPETVQAMAIGGGKVLAVGTTEEITRLAGPKTRLK